MRQCIHCDRWFRSKQSVKAHLRHCEPWKRKKAAGYRKDYILVPAFMCALCWTGPTPHGYAGIESDLREVEGFCHTCEAPGHWVPVGKKRLSVDQARELGYPVGPG